VASADEDKGGKVRDDLVIIFCYQFFPLRRLLGQIGRFAFFLSLENGASASIVLDTVSTSFLINLSFHCILHCVYTYRIQWKFCP
jgi:hypothetical protein